jgi:A/G-specific adenine glycosylase
VPAFLYAGPVVAKKLVPLLLDWFLQHRRDLPWRHTTDPYAIWVSEIMLQQTQVKTVIPYWERWMRVLPDLKALARARTEKLHKLWEGLGYYTRVRNMHRAARIICREYGGQFPTRYEEVLALPGIGRYTAGAVCSIAFNQATPILDGNVIRVLARAFCIEGDPRERSVNARLWAIALELVRWAAGLEQRERRDRGGPDAGRGKSSVRTASAFNQALMELGALVCTPRSPQCNVCPLLYRCEAKRRGRVAEFPQLRPRVGMTARKFAAFVLQHQGRVLVRRRPAGNVNAHLWEFPNVEVIDGLADLSRTASSLLGGQPLKLAPLCVIKHSITRYRVTTQVFEAVMPHPRLTAAEAAGRWVPLKRLDRLPFVSAHKKVLDYLRKTGTETDGEAGR